MIFKFFTMTLLGAFGMWVAIPVGLTMKLNPLIVSLSTSFGAVLGLMLILSLGNPIRRWYVERYFKKEEQLQSRFLNWMLKSYGTIGYGLLAPLVIGAHIGALFGLILGIPTRGLFVWLSIGTFIWCILFTILATSGLAGIKLFL
jgi:hypothetical protein